MTLDYAQRFIFDDTDIRGELVHLEHSMQAVMAHHAYPAAVRQLLGEFLAASVLLGSTVKFNGRLVLQVRSEGSVRLLVAECSMMATFAVLPASANSLATSPSPRYCVRVPW